MKTVKIMSVLVVLAATLATVVEAGNPTKRGTAGALELQLPVGGRGSALGGAALSLSSGLDAIHWNPAGLAAGIGLNGAEAMFSHSDYIADIGIDYVGVGIGMGELGALGLTLRSLNFGDMLWTTEDNPDGTGATFSPSFITLGVTYSKALTDRISIGFTTKFINETIIRTSASGFAFDGGVIYGVSGDSPLKGLKFGIVLKNIGPNMSYSGSDLEQTIVPPNSDPSQQPKPLRFVTQDFELPSTFEMGISYDVQLPGNNAVSLSGAFENANFGSDQFRGGLEYNFSDFVYLRAGYVSPDGERANYIRGMSFGGGLNFDFGGAKVGVDYTMADADIFDSIQTFAIRIGF